jgi:transcription elongation factor GreA
MTSPKITLSEAATRYLAKLTPEEREARQPEVNRFVRWFGSERPVAQLTPPEVANYAERLSLSDTDYAKRLEQVRAFLVCAKKDGWTPGNLSVHLKAKRMKPGPVVSVRPLPEVTHLTKQGYDEIKAELAGLKERRPHLIEEIRKAAADKDFRENAPLHAAREKLGHLEGRIIELEETLKVAKVIDESPKSTFKANIGDSLVLQDLASGEEVKYQIVTPREVDPTQGKISSVSPIGKALLGRGQGDTVEISVPAGKLRYQIRHIEH